MSVWQILSRALGCTGIYLSVVPTLVCLLLVFSPLHSGRGFSSPLSSNFTQMMVLHTLL